MLPDVNIGADVNEGCRWVTDCLAMLIELEDAVVDVVGAVHRNVAVDRLGAPKLGRHVDDKGTGTGCEGGHLVGVDPDIRSTGARRQAGVEEQSGRKREGRIGVS